MSNSQFKDQCALEIENQGSDLELRELSEAWINKANSLNYSYHFEVIGRPIIQYPQDMVATQEIISKCKPDIILETGIAHGGSIYSQHLCFVC